MKSNDIARGISGPRRTAKEPLETAAANAEASKLADVLGVSSSSQRNSSFLRDNSSPIASDVSTPIAKQRRRFIGRLFPKESNNVDEDTAKDYHAFSSDCNADVTTSESERPPQANLASVYSPPPRADYGAEVVVYDKNDERSIRTSTFSVDNEELDAFDANGNLAPYRDGPYDIHHDYYGRQIKRRWCKQLICL